MTARRQPQDMGGLAAGPIDTADHPMAFWERQISGLRAAVVRSGMATLDELRRAQEDLGDRYHELGYWERAASALRTVLLERGVLTADEIDARVEQVRSRAADPSPERGEPQ